jgi:hypothetical protein
VGSGSIFEGDLYQMGIYNPAGNVGTQPILIRKIYGIDEVIDNDAFISVDYLSPINVAFSPSNGKLNTGDIVDGNPVQVGYIVATTAQNSTSENKVAYVGDGSGGGGVKNLPPISYIGKLIRVNGGATQAGSIWFAQSANVFKKIFPYAVDNTTIEISADKLRVKDGGITNAKLAGAITNDKLATDPLARANHTGTQEAATISDFGAAADARIANWVGATPAAFDTLVEIGAALSANTTADAAMTTSLGNRVRFDAAQSLDSAQKTQACDNIGVGDPDTDFVAVFNTGLI